MARLIMGDFEGERFWEREGSIKLPSLKRDTNLNLAMAMEELQALFCQEDDILYTRFPMNFYLKNYLNDIEVKFENKYANTENTSQYKNSIMEEFYNKQRGENLFWEQVELDPFEVNLFTEKLVMEHKIKAEIPQFEIVQKVNSKLYSCKMRERLSCKNNAREIYNTRELEKAFQEFQAQKKICLLKEEYGVSGQGSILLQTESICQRIITYIKRKEEKGEKLRLIIEPFLEKEKDFSCQFLISPLGKYQFLSVQQVWNNGLAYKGSITPDEGLIRFLQEKGYFDLIEKLAYYLFQDGYYGHACVDSMLLKGGQIEPIIEINARKCMGLLKYSADCFLKKYRVQCLLSFFDFIGTENSCSFEEMLEFLKKEKILFTVNHTKGIIPLTEKTMVINKEIGKSYKGKIYFLCVEENISKIQSLLERWKLLLGTWGIKLV